MENKRLYGKICYLQRQMYRENAKIFADINLTPMQVNTLVFIHKSILRGEVVRQREVEQHVNLRASSVSTLLSNLEAAGYVTRKTSEGDARAKHLELTDKGLEACLKNKLLMESCDGAIQSALTADEQEEFERLLTKIIDSVKSEA